MGSGSTRGCSIGYSNKQTLVCPLVLSGKLPRWQWVLFTCRPAISQLRLPQLMHTCGVVRLNAICEEAVKGCQRSRARGITYSSHHKPSVVAEGSGSHVQRCLRPMATAPRTFCHAPTTASKMMRPSSWATHPWCAPQSRLHLMAHKLFKALACCLR